MSVISQKSNKTPHPTRMSGKFRGRLVWVVALMRSGGLDVSSQRQQRIQSRRVRKVQHEAIKILKPLDLSPRLTCLRSAFSQMVR